MKRALVLAAAALFMTTAAYAQGSVSTKYDWNDKTKSCLEPYAPAIPKPEETNLKELLEEVKPEIQAFIDNSNKYLECLSVRLAAAREEGDKEKIKKIIKAHNDNVEYQQSVASEFNATLKTLKEQAGLAVSESAEKSEADDEADSGGEGAAESAQSEEASEASASGEGGE